MPHNDKPSKTVSKKPLCFVIGPIGKDSSPERKHSDLLLNAVIKQVLQNDEFGYAVKRADEDADPGMIGDRVVSDIINAELVVADLTDLNPNAFYELGIRHSTEKPTIHIARAGTSLPFDNIAHRTIFVDLGDWHSTEQARSRLAESIRATRASDYKVSNPITQANASFNMRLSEDPRDRTLAEMQERISSLEREVSTSSFTSTDADESAEQDALNALITLGKKLKQRGLSDSEIVRRVKLHSKKLLPHQAKVTIEEFGDKGSISVETDGMGMMDYFDSD